MGSIVGKAYALEESPTYGTFTTGRIVSFGEADIQKGIEEFYSRYPRGGYMSETGEITLNKETGYYEVKTQRLTSCE